MTTLYASQQASSYATLKRKGAAVSFIETLPGTLDPVTETYSGATTVTVAGYAVRVAGDPIRYRALELIQSENPTLLFGSTTAGSLPAVGSRVTWNALAYTVRDVEPLAPDGPAILAYIIIAR